MEELHIPQGAGVWLSPWILENPATIEVYQNWKRYYVFHQRSGEYIHSRAFVYHDGRGWVASSGIAFTMPGYASVDAAKAAAVFQVENEVERIQQLLWEEAYADE